MIVDPSYFCRRYPHAKEDTLGLGPCLTEDDDLFRTAGELVPLPGVTEQYGTLIFRNNARSNAPNFGLASAHGIRVGRLEERSYPTLVTERSRNV